MSTPYVGEIRMFAGNYAPAGWMLCQGQLLPIAENPTLFNLIGTTYGGDGQSTFALPDLRSRAPVHMGQGLGTSNYSIGQQGGVEQVTLTAQQVPSHTHTVNVNNGTPSSSSAGNNLLASASGNTNVYSTSAPDQAMSANAVSKVGGSQPHSNIQPYLAINFIISLFGVYPSPS